jgi:hypothetical protein
MSYDTGYRLYTLLYNQQWCLCMILPMLSRVVVDSSVAENSQNSPAFDILNAILLDSLHVRERF